MARVLIPPDVQYNLCLSAREQLGLSWNGLAKYLQVNSSTFENWYKCTRLLPKEIFDKLSEISRLSIKDFKLLPDNWGLVKGGKASLGKQGGKFWTLEGSRKEGRNSANEFINPDYSEDLAEFIGIMLGDGGISRTQISITLGNSTDHEYVPYIIRLIKKLFRVIGSISYPLNKDVVRIRVSGVNLTKNLKKLGLVEGDKIEQKIDIPVWILQREIYIKACIRGLIDTDGCVHRKVRREKDGREYRSIGITFCSASKPLQISVIKLFARLGFKAAISGRTIYLCGKEQVNRYINEIRFSNPKHLNRYQNFLPQYGWIKIS